MELTEATQMAKKSKRPGRPAAPEAYKSLASIKGPVRAEKWLQGLVDHTRLGTRTLLIWNALRAYAEQHGYTSEFPKW